MARVVFVLAVVFIAVSAAFLLESDGEFEEEGLYHREKRGLFDTIVNGLCYTKNVITLAVCCKKPAVGPFWNNTIYMRCNLNRTDATLFRVFSDYILNTLTNSKGFLDLTQALTVNTLGPAFCVAECVFRNQSLYMADGVTLDSTKVADKLASLVPAAWQATVKEAVTNCSAIIEGTKITTVTVGKAKCSTKPALLLQCVRRSLVSTCPAPLWTNNTICKNALNDLKSCPAYKLPF